MKAPWNRSVPAAPESEAPLAPSDEEIVARVRAGETDLFALLLQRYNQRVYRMARAVLRDDAEAEDVTQEAWVRAFRHLDQFERRARFSTWLTRIALYEALARARRARRFVDISDGETRVTGRTARENPEKDASDRELRSHLEAAVETLPDPYRVVYVLREIEELSTAETAESLEVSEETIKTRLHRARAMLRRELLGRVGPILGRAFPFLGGRCDRMVERVMGRIRSVPDPMAPR